MPRALMVSVRGEELWPHIPHQQRQCSRPGQPKSRRSSGEPASYGGRAHRWPGSVRTVSASCNQPGVHYAASRFRSARWCPMAAVRALTSAGTARRLSRARNGGRPGCREPVTSPRLPPSASRGPVPRLDRCQPMIPCQPSFLALPTRHSPLLTGSSLRLLDRCRHGGDHVVS